MDLKRESGEWKLANSGTRVELTQRLHKYLQRTSEDPATVKFKVPYSVEELFNNQQLQDEMTAIQGGMAAMRGQIQ